MNLPGGKRVLSGFALILVAFFENQLAPQLDVFWGWVAVSVAATIGYGLLVSSEPARGIWRWAASGTRRRIVGTVLAVGVCTGLVGASVAMMFIRREGPRAEKAPGPSLQKSEETASPRVVNAPPTSRPPDQKPIAAGPKAKPAEQQTKIEQHNVTGTNVAVGGDLNAPLTVNQPPNPNVPLITYTQEGHRRETSPGRFVLRDGEEATYARFDDLLRAGDWEGIVSVCHEAQARTPAWATPWAYEGLANKMLGRKQRAIELLETAAQMMAGNPDYQRIEAAVRQDLRDLQGR